MNENRMMDLKYLCNKKWRLENPTGYFGQMRHGSVREASEWMCRLAGFKGLEEADAYFKHQNAAEQEAMKKKADALQIEQPAWTAEQQSYVREQLQSGLEGTEVKREMPKNVMALPILILGLIVAAWLLLMGNIKKE